MVLNKVKEIKGKIISWKWTKENSNINLNVSIEKLEYYEKMLKTLIESDEYKEAIKEKLKKDKKIKVVGSRRGEKNPMAWSNRRYDYEKESKKNDKNHGKEWTDSDLETVYSSDIKIEIDMDNFFIPESEGNKIKKLCKNVERRYFGVEAHLRVKGIYLSKKEIRDFYKDGEVLKKSAEQMKKVLDKMIKEGKLKFKEDVITSK